MCKDTKHTIAVIPRSMIANYHYQNDYTISVKLLQYLITNY